MSTKGVKVKKENKIYVIHYRGELLANYTWPNGGRSHLSGWRPAKKVYFTLATARSGARSLPDEIREDCEIVEYGPQKSVEKLSKYDRLISEAKGALKRATRNANLFIRWRDEFYIKGDIVEAKQYEAQYEKEEKNRIFQKNEVDRLTAEKKALNS